MGRRSAARAADAAAEDAARRRPEASWTARGHVHREGHRHALAAEERVERRALLLLRLEAAANRRREASTTQVAILHTPAPIR